MMYRSPVSDHRGSRANLQGHLVNRSTPKGKKFHKLRPFIDEPELCHKPDEARVLQLPLKFVLEAINGAQRILLFLQNVMSNAVQYTIDALPNPN
jgi:hypothetical protein